MHSMKIKDLEKLTPVMPALDILERILDPLSTLELRDLYKEAFGGTEDNFGVTGEENAKTLNREDLLHDLHYYLENYDNPPPS